MTSSYDPRPARQIRYEQLRARLRRLALHYIGSDTDWQSRLAELRQVMTAEEDRLREVQDKLMPFGDYAKGKDKKPWEPKNR